MKDRGRELCEWAENVDDQVLRSKGLIALAFLAIAFQYPDRPAHRIARDSLASAGNITVGWRMRAHWYRALSYFLFDLDRCEAATDGSIGCGAVTSGPCRTKSAASSPSATSVRSTRPAAILSMQRHVANDFPDLDGDLLVAAAMLRLDDNDPERASVLLGAVNNLRSHFGICMYMEVHERVHGRPEGDLAKARMAVMHRRLDQRDPARTRAARAMLDDELAQVALSCTAVTCGYALSLRRTFRCALSLLPGP